MSAGTALTADFDSPQKGFERLRTYVAATSAVIYEGSLVMLNASGLAVRVPTNNGSTNNAALRVVGQAVTSLAGTEAAGSTVTVRTDVDVVLDQVTSAAIVQANVGAVLYATSDHEVTTTSTLNPKVGVCVGLGEIAPLTTAVIALTTVTPA